MPEKKPKRQNAPRYVSDPNDKGLRAYNDSLAIYNAFHQANVDMIKRIYEKNKKDYLDNPDEYFKNQGYGSITRDINSISTPSEDYRRRLAKLEQQENRTEPQLYKDGTIKNPFNNRFWQGEKYKPTINNVKEIAERIAPVGILGEYPDVYKKPVQPIILQKNTQQAVRKKATTPATPIVTNKPTIKNEQNIENENPLKDSVIVDNSSLPKPAIPKYTSPKKMYQGYRFTTQTGLRAGWYHPEEVAAAMESRKKK
jgi:hypothetical protein